MVIFMELNCMEIISNAFVRSEEESGRLEYNYRDNSQDKLE